MKRSFGIFIQARAVHEPYYLKKLAILAIAREQPESVQMRQVFRYLVELF